MRLEASHQTHVGRRREHNEDAILVDLDARIGIVCDGMGGHAAGEVAARIATETFMATLARDPITAAPEGDGEAEHRRQMVARMEAAVRAANAAVYEHAAANPEQRGMGTTLTAIAFGVRCAYVAHVGDSRLYLVRNGETEQVTSDHTIFSEMVRAGRLDPKDTPRSKRMNALTRAVGVYESVRVDTLVVDLLPEDTFILCSDGLHNYVDERIDFSAILKHSERETVAGELVAFANRAGGSDNISVAVFFVRDGEETAVTRRVRLTLGMLRAIPLFEYLSFAELLRIITICRPEVYRAGESVIEIGDEGDALYVVVDGQVKVHQGDRTLAVLGSGRHFGEMSLIDNQPRSASVTSITESQLIRIERTAFYEVLREDSVMAVKLLWNFIQTLTHLVRERQIPEAGATPTPTVAHPYNDQGSDK